MKFKFNSFSTQVIITDTLPQINEKNALIVCDENTKYIAEKINVCSLPVCVLDSGEENKNWNSIERILLAAKNSGLGRDSVFIGAGGGVIGDLTGFAASIYMRGVRLQLAATTLLAMVDASVGGKTGFDLGSIKNLAGTFYPAEKVYMPMEALKTLPEKEYKSGLAELIKTNILSGAILCDLCASALQREALIQAIKFKAKIVSQDLMETKNKRALLNLGHTFGHALETAAGLGNITHGEAVAWGIVQACLLGVKLSITPVDRAKEIINLIKSLGYDCSSPHHLAQTSEFLNALKNDKKNKQGALNFIIPNKKSAEIVALNKNQITVLHEILKDGFVI